MHISMNKRFAALFSADIPKTYADLCRMAGSVDKEAEIEEIDGKIHVMFSDGTGAILQDENH